LKGADVAFAVIAANAVSTLAMLIYPLIAVALGYDPKATGIFLGATIHDVAQVPVVVGSMAGCGKCQ
jgi:uncharacterized membrane protein YadS